MSNTNKNKSYSKRPYYPQNKLLNKFQSASKRLAIDFFETKEFDHALTKGEEREKPLINFFKRNLPSIYNVVSGEVVDVKNRSSNQLDLMIYDESRNIPFFSGSNYILPAEALLAGIEIKSKLNRNEIKRILHSANNLKNLKPFGKKPDLSVSKRDIKDKITCRYMYTVFAYSTDISQSNWLSNEFKRISEVASQEKISPNVIDRILVLDRGLINCSDSVGTSLKDNAETFLYYYMGILNFITRENSRRKATPYLDYAGKLSKGWMKLKE